MSSNTTLTDGDYTVFEIIYELAQQRFFFSQQIIGEQKKDFSMGNTV
jgi:hypothetical protein